MLGRRGLFAGFAAALVTPAIVRAASLMPVRVLPLVAPPYNGLLTIDQITRGTVKLWKNTNAFMQVIDQEYDDQFARHVADSGYSLRTRIPPNVTITP